MREIRQSGLEGGGAVTIRLSLPLSNGGGLFRPHPNPLPQRRGFCSPDVVSRERGSRAAYAAVPCGQCPMAAALGARWPMLFLFTDGIP